MLSRLYKQLSVTKDRVDINTDIALGVCLGHGANAACYDAYINSSGKKCVAKIFNNDHGTTMERKILRTLEGEDLCFSLDLVGQNNFVRSFGYNFGNQQMFLVYEKMDCTLTNFTFDENLNKKTQQIIKIVYDLFFTLSPLHKRNLAHKDVHIENVLMLGNHAKLADLESVSYTDTPGILNLHLDRSQWQYFDVAAVGYIMCQLITGDTGMNFYPGDRDLNGQPTDQQLQVYQALVGRATETINNSNINNPNPDRLIEFIHNLVNAREIEFSSEDAWRYINQYLTPRFHGNVNDSTAFDDHGGGNIIFLDRHRVEVRDYASALRSFTLQTQGSQIRFQFSRQRILNVSVDALCINNYSTHAVDCPGQGGTTFCLNNLAVNPPNLERRGFLKRFQIVRQDNDGNFNPNQIKILFTLIEGGGVWDNPPEEHNTIWNNAGHGSNFFLDRHLVEANGENHAITGFKIESNEPNNQIRFKFWTQRCF